MANNTAADAFAALGDPTRRALFERLSKGPACVRDLSTGALVSRPAVSQHLKVLKSAGLVMDVRDGARRVYRVDPRGVGALRDWLDSRWGEALEAFASATREEALK